jgi:hypothetical protein
MSETKLMLRSKGILPHDFASLKVMHFLLARNFSWLTRNFALQAKSV